MEPFALVIFGITSNLAQIKLIPALYDMAEKGLLPKKMAIVGVARKPLDPKQVQKLIKEAVTKENVHHRHSAKAAVLKDLASKVSYVPGNLDDPNFFQQLRAHLQGLSTQGIKNTIFYLATYPDLYADTFKNLKRSGLNTQTDGSWVRLMIEKPIGSDLESAKKLNQLLAKYFSEDQIFRLDHYLGKETLQNILTFRFGNDVFEPLINKDYVDHIQISALESFGIGKRGGYYDSVGALKDVGQNHQLQMLAFATMEAPAQFTNRAVTDQRIKILQKLV